MNIPLFHLAQPSVVHAWQVSLRAAEYCKSYGCWSTRAVRKTPGIWGGSSPAPWAIPPLWRGLPHLLLFHSFATTFSKFGKHSALLVKLNSTVKTHSKGIASKSGLKPFPVKKLHRSAPRALPKGSAGAQLLGGCIFL